MQWKKELFQNISAQDAIKFIYQKGFGQGMGATSAQNRVK